MTHLEKIGQDIRTAREAQSLTHRQLSERCGIDFAELSRIESGKRNMTVATLVRLAEALDCELIVELESHRK